MQIAKANNLVALQLARGVVTLVARPSAPAPSAGAPATPTSGASVGARLPGRDTHRNRGTGRGRDPPGSSCPQSRVRRRHRSPPGWAGALALLALLAQPFVGDWLGRGSSVLSSDEFTACPWEER